MFHLVSIIVPAYNAEKFLAQAIESCLNQTWPYKEIIVVNDGSIDATLKVALQFERKGVKVIDQPNQGASAARNRGYLESKGDFIQFLDADDVLAPDKIEQQLNSIESINKHDLPLLAGKWGLFYSSINDAIFESNKLWKDFSSPVDWLVTAWQNQQWLHPSVWLTPRKTIEMAGLWDESLSLHDDGEFFCRVLLKSKRIVFCNKAISYYRKGLVTSLSSLVSPSAVDSHYKICQLYESLLISAENSPRVRLACATNYLSFYYSHFPGNAAIRMQAKKNATRLGGSSYKPTGTRIFLSLEPILGWRLAKLIERFYLSHGIGVYGFVKRFKRILPHH